jgi:hypothetical protein
VTETKQWTWVDENGNVLMRIYADGISVGGLVALAQPMEKIFKGKKIFLTKTQSIEQPKH